MVHLSGACSGPIDSGAVRFKQKTEIVLTLKAASIEHLSVLR